MGLSAIWKKKLHGNRPIIARGKVQKIALKPMWLLINHTNLANNN